MKKIQYIGIDVDDNMFHVYGVLGDGTRGVKYRSKPSVGALVKGLEKIKESGYEQKLCYEATYLGFSLQRALKEKGYECEIIAPSLIPKVAGRKVKTDRIDAKKLAMYYWKGLLTAVHIPDEEEESVRDLIRSRNFIKDQTKALKVHFLACCRRIGINYRESMKNDRASYWTTTHLKWIVTQIKELKQERNKLNLTMLKHQIEILEEQVSLYNQQIEQIAEEERYERKAKALCSYRGISTLSAMTLIVEIGDIHRFDHPSRLTSYAGMDLIEYSSGGKENKFRMTKMGNRNIRRTVVESAQFALKPPQISRQLKERRKGVEIESIEVANRCMNRLYKKSTRLLYAGKMRNKVKVACARELLGFVWESLRKVS